MTDVADAVRLVRNQGVTAPEGFRAAGIAAGIKSSGALDLALVFNEGPDHAAAGVFTRNRVKAAPVLWTQQVLTTGRLRAVILNSGEPTPAPGRRFPRHARHRGGRRRRVVGLGQRDRGDRGRRLLHGAHRRPAADGQGAGRRSGSGARNGGRAHRRRARGPAIMTTDTVPKQVALHHPGNWTVGGMAKGAGMLAPSLATMLCVLTTDAVAEAAALDHALRRAAALTFDRLDVDGSCSTNDTVLLLASGASEIAPSQADLDDAVQRVCDDLCAQLQADAEGVTKRITVAVTGAASDDDAVTAARAIARDSLVKTAMFGSDPNWAG
ncbi:arginine biosynthesis bifunctional protein ArgJ [Mycobacterium xenopi 3993]|nr:arginine biosynthesis bifunctional protein ArgJ [Mycobacterium xenopi 3993]